jgi:O-methyltransferase involved in polyketide biosynthesis
LSEKLHPDELKGVSETLLIPLHYRVLESRSESSAFRDQITESFHDAIDYDWDKFESQSLLRRVMPARTAIFDAEVGSFLARVPDGLVLNLGAGLDTRFHRLDNGSVRWVELDLPSVIACRRRLEEPVSARHRLIAGSVLEDTWIRELDTNPADRVLLVAEGLLSYFTQEEHRTIFNCLATHFPGQQMLFQTFAPSLIEGLVQYSDLSKMRGNVEVRWGLDDSTQVASLIDRRIHFIAEFPLLRGGYDQLPEPIRQKLSPEQARRVGKIVHVRFDG